MTWLGLLNFAVLQWFGVRLARWYEYGDAVYTPRAATMPDPLGMAVERGAPIASGYRIIGLVLPLSGWWTDYRYVWRWR